MAFEFFKKITPLGIGGGASAPAGLPLTIDDVLPAADGRAWSPETCGVPARSITFSLTNTKSDAEQIIEYLSAFALRYGRSPCIVRFGRCLIGDVVENNAVEAHFSAVANFVLDHVSYVADPRGAEYVRSPVRMIGDYCRAGYAQGDCDDMTLLAASLLNSLGFRVRVVAVKLNGSAHYNHVLTQVFVRDGWKWFDGCNKDDPSKAWDDFIFHEL